LYVYLQIKNAMLTPPDGTVFVESVNNKGKHIEAVIESIGADVDYEVGTKVGIIGHIEKLEIQGETKFSVNEKYIAFIIEQ
jgi:hypothetical protein